MLKSILIAQWCIQQTTAAVGSYCFLQLSSFSPRPKEDVEINISDNKEEKADNGNLTDVRPHASIDFQSAESKHELDDLDNLNEEAAGGSFDAVQASSDNTNGKSGLASSFDQFASVLGYVIPGYNSTTRNQAVKWKQGEEVVYESSQFGRIAGTVLRPKDHYVSCNGANGFGCGYHFDEHDITHWCSEFGEASLLLNCGGYQRWVQVSRVMKLNHVPPLRGVNVDRDPMMAAQKDIPAITRSKRHLHVNDTPRSEKGNSGKIGKFQSQTSTLSNASSNGRYRGRTISSAGSENRRPVVTMDQLEIELTDFRGTSPPNSNRASAWALEMGAVVKIHYRNPRRGHGSEETLEGLTGTLAEQFEGDHWSVVIDQMQNLSDSARNYCEQSPTPYSVIVHSDNLKLVVREPASKSSIVRITANGKFQNLHGQIELVPWTHVHTEELHGMYKIVITEPGSAYERHDVGCNREDFEVVVDSSEFTELNVFENGPVLAVLYKMACECENFDRWNPNLRPRLDYWERWARFAIFPMVLQTFLLDKLTENLAGDDDGYFYENSEPLYVIVGIMIFIFEAFTWLSGPSLLCLYSLCQTHFNKHRKPWRTWTLAWILYLSDLFIGLRTIFIAPTFIQSSESRVDLIVNVTAVSFILNIDDFASAIFSFLSFGEGHLKVPNAIVPNEDVLHKSEHNPASLSKTEYRTILLKWFLTEFFLDMPLIPIILSILAYFSLMVNGAEVDSNFESYTYPLLAAGFVVKILDNLWVTDTFHLYRVSWMKKIVFMMQTAITLIIGFTGVCFVINNFRGLGYSAGFRYFTERKDGVGYLFAGLHIGAFQIGDTPDDSSKACHCHKGNCNQAGGVGCSCSGGFCRQTNCKHCTCEGGGCDQRYGCDDCSCDGGACNQDYCNFGAEDDTPGCTCDAGGCAQTYCNAFSIGNGGGCTCHGGNCDQGFCNFFSFGDNGGCDCLLGNCDQQKCNFLARGSDGGCSCEGGWCDQSQCNAASGTTNGGCSCGYGCEQTYCNALNNGTNGGCVCDGGRCDQEFCNSENFAFGVDGGCSCVGGSCNQRECNTLSAGEHGGCSCDGGNCDQSICNFFSADLNGGCDCTSGCFQNSCFDPLGVWLGDDGCCVDCSIGIATSYPTLDSSLSPSFAPTILVSPTRSPTSNV